MPFGTWKLLDYPVQGGADITIRSERGELLSVLPAEMSIFAEYDPRSPGIWRPAVIQLVIGLEADAFAIDKQGLQQNAVLLDPEWGA
jgi:hypothetical protein